MPDELSYCDVQGVEDFSITQLSTGCLLLLRFDPPNTHHLMTNFLSLSDLLSRPMENG